MKRIEKITVVLIVVGIFISACQKQKTNAAVEAAVMQEVPRDYAGTLTMWGWDDPYFNAMTAAFNKLYPNVKFEYTPVANGDLLQKYQTALATGLDLPDIPWAIIDSRAKVFELDMWEPLNKAPYNLDINDTFDYLHNVMINSEGDICGIEQSICPAGLAYRRDLTKEYFGTDDPKELEAMFPTWDAFIQKGIEVRQKSGGTVYMWPGMGDAQQFIREQGAASWIEGNTVKASAALLRPIQLACKFRDAGIADKLEAWSPAWYACFGEGKHIFVGCATWSVPFMIEPGDPEGKDTGRWGLMNVPEGNISWGGTTLGISKTCKDKALAWTFVKWACLSTSGAEALNSIGFFTSAKKPYTENPAIVSFKSAWFGDQDLGEKYIGEIVPNIKIRPMNFDDNEVHSALGRIVQRLNNDRSINAEQAMKLLKEELEVTMPDYTVE